MSCALLVGTSRDRPCSRRGCRAPGLGVSYVNVVALLLGFGEAGHGLVEGGLPVDGEHEDEPVLAVRPEVVQGDEDLLT